MEEDIKADGQAESGPGGRDRWGRTTVAEASRSSDNDLAFTSRRYTALVRSYALRQEFITPHGPEQNGAVERVVRTLQEQCVHHGFARKRGYTIGSGGMESANKFVCHVRLKRSGA